MSKQQRHIQLLSMAKGGLVVFLALVFALSVLPAASWQSDSGIISSESSLQDVIRSLQGFSDMENSDNALAKIRSVIVSFQVASGLCSLQCGNFDESSDSLFILVKSVFCLLLAAIFMLVLHIVRDCGLRWSNLYSSITLCPNPPPPLFSSFHS